MTTTGQIEAHDAVVGLQKGCVHCKVGRAAAWKTHDESVVLLGRRRVTLAQATAFTKPSFMDA